MGRDLGECRFPNASNKERMLREGKRGRHSAKAIRKKIVTAPGDSNLRHEGRSSQRGNVNESGQLSLTRHGGRTSKKSAMIKVKVAWAKERRTLKETQSSQKQPVKPRSGELWPAPVRRTGHRRKTLLAGGRKVQYKEGKRSDTRNIPGGGETTTKAVEQPPGKNPASVDHKKKKRNGVEGQREASKEKENLTERIEFLPGKPTSR